MSLAASHVLPGPRGLSAAVQIPRIAVDPIGVAEYMRLRHGTVSEIRLGGTRFLFISCARIAHAILKDEAAFPEKGVGLAEARRFLGDGLLTSRSGNVWKVKQSSALPFFRHAAVTHLLTHCEQEVDSQLALVCNGNRTSLNVTALISRTLAAAFSTALVGDGLPNECHSAIVRDLFLLERWAAKQLVLPFRWCATLRWKLSASARGAYRRLTELAQIALSPPDIPPTQQGKNDCKMSLQDRTDELLTLLFAGITTTTAATSWTLDLLSRDPKVLLAAHQQVTAVNREKTSVEDRLRGYLLLRSSVQEALRLYPPVWAITRQCVRPTEVDGLMIRRGTQVIVNIYGMHRDSHKWDRPTDFFPARFAPGAIVPAEYLPFGAGRRQCIGMHIGLSLATLIAAHFVRRLELRPARPVTAAVASLTLAPRGGLTLLLNEAGNHYTCAEV